MNTSTDQALDLLVGTETALTTERGLVGLDGFVDRILRVVDKRNRDGSATYIANIPGLASRIQDAAGKSTKFELSLQQVKLGGNGPIMAQALATLGLPLTCIGNLGHPDLHPIFQPMEKTCRVITIAEPCYTDALEFGDGKIMLSQQETVRKITWNFLEDVMGKEALFNLFDQSSFIALNNWSALPHMSEIWRQLQDQVCAHSQKDRKKRCKIFFDLADPAFRSATDIREALDLISKFQTYMDSTLGLNQKEAGEICEALSLQPGGKDREFVRQSAEAIRSKLKIEHVVVHATAYAAAASEKKSAVIEGPYIESPIISTGAGDHFNAGYSLGLIRKGNLEQCLQLGVATSGSYVRTAKSPSLVELRNFLKKIG